MNRLAERLKAIRESKGWSQQEVAERAKIPQSSIHYIEGGTRKPRIDTIQKLAAALGVSVADLLEDEPAAMERAG